MGLLMSSLSQQINNFDSLMKRPKFIELDCICGYILWMKNYELLLAMWNYKGNERVIQR